MSFCVTWLQGEPLLTGTTHEQQFVLLSTAACMKKKLCGTIVEFYEEIKPNLVCCETEVSVLEIHFLVVVVVVVVVSRDRCRIAKCLANRGVDCLLQFDLECLPRYKA